MKKANFVKVFLGLETPNEKSLTECSKLQNTTKNISKLIKQIHNYGMQVMGGFIVGFDNDSKTIFESQIKFIQE